MTTVQFSSFIRKTRTYTIQDHNKSQRFLFYLNHNQYHGDQFASIFLQNRWSAFLIESKTLINIQQQNIQKCQQIN